jgi:hypothetical protein
MPEVNSLARASKLQGFFLVVGEESVEDERPYFSAAS